MRQDDLGLRETVNRLQLVVDRVEPEPEVRLRERFWKLPDVDFLLVEGALALAARRSEIPGSAFAATPPVARLEQSEALARVCGTAPLKQNRLEPRDRGSESLRVSVGFVACLLVLGPWSDCAEVCTVLMRCLSLSYRALVGICQRRADTPPRRRLVTRKSY